MSATWREAGLAADEEQPLNIGAAQEHASFSADSTDGLLEQSLWHCRRVRTKTAPGQPVCKELSLGPA